MQEAEISVNWFIGTDTVRCLGTSLQATHEVYTEHVACVSTFLHFMKGFLILGACTQFQHTIISFIMLAIQKEQIGSDCTIIHVLLHSKIFGKSIEKIQDLYNIATITSTLREDVCTSFMTTPNIILLRMRNISDKSCRENKNTYFTFHNFFPKIVPFERYCWKMWYIQTGHIR